jgi:hypothetical protein
LAIFGRMCASLGIQIIASSSLQAKGRVERNHGTRVLSNDWVIRYATRHFQVARQSHQAPAKSTVLVRENGAGAIELPYGGA